MAVEDGGNNVSDKDDDIENGGNPLQSPAEEADGDDGEKCDKDGEDRECERNWDLTEYVKVIAVALMHKPGKDAGEDDGEA